MARTLRRESASGMGGLLARELLLAWLGFFAFLSVDVLVRIIGIRGQFDSALDAFTLIAIEGCRAVTLILAVSVAGNAIRHSRRTAAAGLFGVFITFAAVWYAKAFAFTGFPGHVQESMALWLRGHGASLSLLDFIFGSPEWSAWIALGAMLRLSVTWPRRLDAGRIEVAGERDRKGMMRSVAFAGADIGAGFRNLAARVLSSGLLEARIIWPAVIMAGAFHSRSPWTAVHWLMTVLLSAGLAVGVTNIRGAFTQATRRQRGRMLWCVIAAVMAGGAFLVSGILSLGGDAGAAAIGVAVASLTPIAMLLALGAVVRRTPPPAGRWLRRSVLIGACGVTGAVAYLLAIATLPAASPELPVREIVALATSAVLVVISVPWLRQLTIRLTPPLSR
ncbi:MAG TPA: hypothetical protein VMM79_01525 [Longimicrobiales bacterium]|nr:hypothetical protein [Longimicrobiales bacterium]